MAFTAETITLLGEVSDALREAFLSDDLMEPTYNYGSDLQRLIQPTQPDFDHTAGEIVWQLETAKSRPAVIGNDITTIGSETRQFEVEKMKARFNETPANNDFAVIDSSAQISLHDLERGARDPRRFVENVIPRLTTQLVDHAVETTALHMVLPRTGLLGTISNAPKQNDRETYAAATSNPNSASGLRFITQKSNFSVYQRGLVVDVHPTGNASAKFSAYVTDGNVHDYSVGLDGWNGTTKRRDTAVDISAGVATDEIYIRNGYGKGMISIGAWLRAPTPAENFFGKDRTDPDQSHLRPTRVAPSSVEAFDESHFNQLATMMGMRLPVRRIGDGRIMVTTPQIVQAAQDLLDGRIIYSPGPNDAPFLAKYGFSAMPVYTHPILGMVAMHGDSFMPENNVWVVRPGDWKSLIARRFSPVPRANSAGGFYNIVNTANGTGTLEYRIDFRGYRCDICTAPQLQGVIENVTGVSY